MVRSELEETCKTYNRHKYGLQEMYCPVDRLSELFENIFEAIGMDYKQQDDE